MFASSLTNSVVIFHCDNLAIVNIINAQSSKNIRVMNLLRKMILIMLSFNIIFKSEDIPGKSNKLCDALSRGQVTDSLLRQHNMVNAPLVVPDWLKPRNYSI